MHPFERGGNTQRKDKGGLTCQGIGFGSRYSISIRQAVASPTKAGCRLLQYKGKSWKVGGSFSRLALRQATAIRAPLRLYRRCSVGLWLKIARPTQQHLLGRNAHDLDLPLGGPRISPVAWVRVLGLGFRVYLRSYIDVFRRDTKIG